MTAQLSEYGTAMMAGDENGSDGGGSRSSNDSNDSGDCVVVGADGDGSVVAAERVVLISFKMDDDVCAVDVDAGSSAGLQDDVGLEQLVVQTQSPPPPSSFSEDDVRGTMFFVFLSRSVPPPPSPFSNTRVGTSGVCACRNVCRTSVAPEVRGFFPVCGRWVTGNTTLFIFFIFLCYTPRLRYFRRRGPSVVRTITLGPLSRTTPGTGLAQCVRRPSVRPAGMHADTCRPRAVYIMNNTPQHLLWARAAAVG